jgi:cytochrome c peroxidase/DNA-binding beta-propeller fold protein YncE
MGGPMSMRLVPLIAVALLAAACSCGSRGAPDRAEPSASSSAVPAPLASSSAVPEARPRAALPSRTGGALARGAGEQALYVADEDHRAVRRVPLPLRSDAAAKAIELPGAPAQVLPLDGRVLVTVRDPGLLLIMKPDPAAGLVEAARVPLPADAWGIAVTADERTALVTSAWTHKVSAVDLASAKKLWTIDVAREPRGVVVRADGAAAYVTHLVGSSLTRIDGLREAPKASPVALPPSPLRSPAGTTLHASLGYAAVMSPDDARLYVARHALGALGESAWFGASTVDVLLTAEGAPLAPAHHDKLLFLRADHGPEGAEITVPPVPLSPFTQPRALAYRKSTHTLLVASEGDDLVAEVDARAVDPSLAVVRTYKVGQGYDPALPVASRCGAPAGLALSEDERIAWVWCRATYDLASVSLDAASSAPPPIEIARLAEDALDADAAIGRRLFYNATDRITSGGLACAGCHPEGRDDGHVWHEAKFNTKDGSNVNFVGAAEDVPREEGVRGAPRRTPMLAGLVNAVGPYGWHAESADLPSRLNAGFGLHRWGGMPPHEPQNLVARSARLAAFLRRGLVPPPREARPLDPIEERGRAIFTSAAARCTSCHVPESGYTDRVAYPLPKRPARPGYDDDPKAELKTPSLLFVGGRAPYFHDGSAETLEKLVIGNDDRMGRTSHLSDEERAALVAFLRTL